ncbi:MAG: hypothetical protein C6W55_09915 [Thermobacillus sp.]|nr:MAG: hypothetical protein C6W55_09915 [Thermobacillus sp.]
MKKEILLKCHLTASLVLALLVLMVLDRAADSTVQDMKAQVAAYAEKELRVPPYDAVVYTPLWIEHLREQPKERPTVAFFGTSTVYGTTVIKGVNTTAGVLQAHRPDVRVLNLGLSGARFTETYAIVSSMIDQFDVAIYEINYGMTVVMENEEEPVVYPALIGKLGGIPRDWVSRFPHKHADALPSGVHRWVADHALNRWTLYRDRDALSYALWKTRTPKEKIRRELSKRDEVRTGNKRPADPLYKPYDQMTDDSKRRIDEGFRNLYTWKRPFDEESSFGLFMIGKTLDLLRAHGKKAVFYTAPLDRQLIDNRKLIRWEEYRRVMNAYRELVESYGYPFIEFNSGGNIVPHRYYRDPTHLTDEGNRLFGETLIKHIPSDILG